jgi:hypothetical protein
MIYLAGPMSGHYLHNFPVFEVAAQALRAQGYEVVSPHELEAVDHDAPKAWDYYMRRALTSMMRCESLALLPGWSRSKGANLELHIARALGFTIYVFVNGELKRRYGNATA